MLHMNDNEDRVRGRKTDKAIKQNYCSLWKSCKIKTIKTVKVSIDLQADRKRDRETNRMTDRQTDRYPN